MCGFFGIIGRYRRDKAIDALNSIVHRGRDYQGIYEEEDLFLGHNRLYILSKKANQPLIKDGKIVVFNGEIYNYEAFGCKSDTEAIIEAYPHFAKLDGMFAFGLVDGAKLYLARDIFGKKPIYYYKDNKNFIFASEIKAIERYLGNLHFNQEALSCYLSFGAISNKMTFYKGVYKLLGGELLELDREDLSFQISSFGSLLEEREGNLEEAIIQAVQKRLQGDFEVATLLSGGVDSSLVSAITKRLQGRLTTYSIGYDEKKYSELEYAKEVAEYIGSEYKEVIFTKEDFFESLYKLIDHYDEPIGDSAAVPLYFLMQEIKKDGYRIVLSGEGGDEIFLGYRQYFEFLDLYKARDLKYKNWLKNYFRSNFSPNKEWEWYKRVFNDEVIFRSSCEVFTDRQKNLFLKQNVKESESLECMEPLLKECDEREVERFFTYVDLKVRLESLYLKKLDLVSMAFSIEARTPLLDKDILSIALNHPQRSKSAKYLLKEIAKNYIPKSVIERKKRGFSYPHMEWLKRSDLIEKMLQINDEINFFDREQLHFLVNSAKRNRFSRHFWLVFAFLLWFERKF